MAYEQAPRLAFDSRIELSSISYSYPSGAKPALRGVDLSIPKRGRIALVGRTGSGKTTLVLESLVPALLAIANRVSDLSGGSISAWGLRIAAALGVSIGVMIGCIRIVTGIPIHWILAAGYAVIVVQSVFAPRVIVPLAYDSGGVTTSVVTVPVVTALGLALAQQVPGRSELLDGFGLLALACIFPAITVLAYAQVAASLEKRILRGRTENPPEM